MILSIFDLEDELWVAHRILLRVKGSDFGFELKRSHSGGEMMLKRRRTRGPAPRRSDGRTGRRNCADRWSTPGAAPRHSQSQEQTRAHENVPLMLEEASYSVTRGSLRNGKSRAAPSRTIPEHRNLRTVDKNKTAGWRSHTTVSKSLSRFSVTKSSGNGSHISLRR